MLHTKIGNLELETCIYNASGPRCTFYHELLELNNCNYTALVLSKSCTLEYRQGNNLPRYYENDLSSINSTGLANLGYKKYLHFGEGLYDKPYFISVSGLTLNDNLTIIKDIHDNETIHGIELNLSCPNIIGKPQIGYDFEMVDHTLSKIFEFYDSQKTIFGIKLPPYFDFCHFEIISDIIKKYPKIQYITCINSLGNGLIINPDNESVVIKPKNGFGGIGGEIIKPIALSNVHKFYQLIGNKVDIIGCGGVKNGKDVFEHILCGANAVQIGTQYMKENIKCFQRLDEELKKIMFNKGYRNINEFKGKLKYME